METKMQIVKVNFSGIHKDKNGNSWNWKTGYDYLVIESNGKIIISDNEGIHTIHNKKTESVNLPVTLERESHLQFGDITVKVWRLLESESKSFSPAMLNDWIRYFGVKSRIASNYAQLIQTCKENGVNVSEFPNWYK